MCGRFFLVAPAIQVLDAFGLSQADPGIAGYQPRFNISPVQTILTITSLGSGRMVISPVIWGMVPIWAARTGEPVKPLINVRSETVLDKPMFRRAVNSGRCLVPASGFFEWLSSGEKSKVPHVIQRPGRKQLLALAAVTDPGDDPSQRAAAILTRASAGPVKGIYERMPVVIEPDDFDAWLDPHRKGGDIEEILARASDRTASMELECFEVGREINKATANSPDLIEPATSQPQKLAKRLRIAAPEQPGLFG